MGETGSGKTTQLPQYIQDARLINGQIGVTQVCFIFVLFCLGLGVIDVLLIFELRITISTMVVTAHLRDGTSISLGSRRIQIILFKLYNLCSILLDPREIMLHKTQFLTQK